MERAEGAVAGLPPTLFSFARVTDAISSTDCGGRAEA